jgi:hypothetical protein
MRILSLVPDGTGIAFALRQGDDAVGLTHECDRPPVALAGPSVVETASADHVARDGASTADRL